MIDWQSDKTRLELHEIQSLAQLYGRGSRVVRFAYFYRRWRNRVYYGLQQKLAGLFGPAPHSKEQLNVLLHLRGGLGDAAAHRLCVLALRQKLPQAVFYFYTDSPDAAKILFEPNWQTVFLPHDRTPARHKYDLAYELCISFKTTHVNKERIAKLAPDFLPILQESLKRQKQLDFFISDNYLMDDALGRFLYHHSAKQMTAQSYLSGLDFDVNDTPALPAELIDETRLETLGLSGKKYITLHSGINASFNLRDKTPLKCWPEENWRALAQLLKKAYPDVLLVQLGGKNSPVFDFVNMSLVGKTKLEDLPILLNHSLLHIDGESGLVQLSRYLKNRCVVLFGPTDAKVFGQDKNINLSAGACGCCMWLSGPQWHTDCPLGHEVCLNMVALSPQKVFEAAQEVLK